MGADGALWSIHAGVGGRRGVFFGRADLEFARGFPSRCLAPPYLGDARGALEPTDLPEEVVLPSGKGIKATVNWVFLSGPS